MNSRKELLGMIATEAAEAISSNADRSQIPDDQLEPIRYDLRLVKYEDGRMEWKD